MELVVSSLTFFTWFTDSVSRATDPIEAEENGIMMELSDALPKEYDVYSK